MSMKVCHTVFHEMPLLVSWEELAERFPGVTHLLRAQQRLGLQVSWIAPSSASLTFFQDEIKIKFVRTARFLKVGSRRQYVGWKQARCVARAAAAENPEVVHQHGLNSWMALRALNELAREHGLHCVVQDHGGGVPALGMKRQLYKKPLAAIRQVIFGDSNMRDLWIGRDLLAPDKCKILFAASSSFSPVGEAERCRLRRQLQMEGAPIFGWVAHLDHNKDPLTILRASTGYFAENLGARLYMHFIKDDLRAACEAMIAKHPILQQRVFLRGRVPHAQLEAFFRAIDYFVQGSHHEAYGYAAVEAISTGAIPILTDIPSFRLLCDDGRCGFLFPPGDARALQHILSQLPKSVACSQRERVHRRFEQEFSYAALAQKLLTLYDKT